MAQITGVMNSTSLRVYVGGTAIAHATDATLTFTHEPRDTTTKDSGGWRDLLEGLRSWSVSATALYADDAAYGFEDLHDTLNATRATVTVLIGTGESGNVDYSGTAWVASLELNSPDSEDNASLSVTFEGSGALTKATTA